MFPVKMTSEEKRNVVVVCVDGSKHSDHAFNWYLENVYHVGDNVCLAYVHVEPESPVMAGFGAGPAVFDIYRVNLERGIEHSRGVVAKYKAMCAEKKIHCKFHVENEDGTVGNTICKIANKEHATHIIAGQRGLGVFRRTFMGSVSDYILHHSHIPTTIVPMVKE